MQFEDFIAQLEPLHEKLSLRLAIECVMTHSNKGVLLLVDEIMKFGGVDEDTKLINQRISDIGGCLDTLTTRFNTVLTTLNIIVTTNATKPSGRPIHWIHLPPATWLEAISLFGEDIYKYPILRMCIADCNGHYRSLEALKLVWCDNILRPYTYPMLIKEVGKRMDIKYRQLTLELIKPALCGEKVDLLATPDGNFTYAEYLARGYYLNTPDQSESSYFVPRISPLQLLLFAQDYTKDSKSTSTLVCIHFLLMLISQTHLQLDSTCPGYLPFVSS